MRNTFHLKIHNSSIYSPMRRREGRRPMIRVVKSLRQVVVHSVQCEVAVRSTHKTLARRRVRRQGICEIRGRKTFHTRRYSGLTRSVGPMCHRIDPGRTRRFDRVGRARQHFAGLRAFSLNCRPRNYRRPVSSAAASSRALRQGVPLVTPSPRPAFSVAARNRAADDDSFLRPSATAVRREMRRRRASDARRERPTRRDDRAVLYLSLSRSPSRPLSLSPSCAGYTDSVCAARASPCVIAEIASRGGVRAAAGPSTRGKI